MTDQEILAATGNQWRVVCADRKQKREKRQVHFVRAATKELAEELGRELSGLPVASASPYQPWDDFEMRGFVSKGTK